MKNIKRLIHLHWFTKEYWQYLLRKPDDKTYTTAWKRFWCRAKGHPNGVWWFNPRGCEPDMTCVDCGDDLG